MDSLQFSRELLTLLKASEVTEVLNKLAKDGYIISGFEKTPGKAPIKLIKKQLAEKKSRGNYYYDAFIRIISEMSIKLDEISLSKLASDWIKNERADVEIVLEQYRIKAEMVIVNEDTSPEQDEINLNNEKEKLIAYAEYEKLQNNYNQLKQVDERTIRDLRKDNGEYKQRIDDLKKSLHEANKDKAKLEILQESICKDLEQERKLKLEAEARIIDLQTDVEKYKEELITIKKLLEEKEALLLIAEEDKNKVLALGFDMLNLTYPTNIEFTFELRGYSLDQCLDIYDEIWIYKNVQTRIKKTAEALSRETNKIVFFDSVKMIKNYFERK